MLIAATQKKLRSTMGIKSLLAYATQFWRIHPKMGYKFLGITRGFCVDYSQQDRLFQLRTQYNH